MNDFAKMDVFFLITTVAVIVLATLVGALLFYILRTAKDISEVTHIVRKETELFAQGAASARYRMKGKSVMQNVIAFVQSFASSKAGRKNTDKE